MPDEFLERIRKTVGGDALPDLSALDRGNDLHVDRAAAELHRHFLASDDVGAWTLLCDLAQDRLCELSQEVAREVGLLEDSTELVVRFFEELMVELGPPLTPTSSFLKGAMDFMRQDAERWVRDIALSSLADPEIPAVWDDDPQAAPVANLHQRATRICFHRLDPALRRALRAKDIEDLTNDQIAERMVLTPDEVGELLAEGSVRLADAVDRELNGGRP